MNYAETRHWSIFRALGTVAFLLGVVACSRTAPTPTPSARPAQIPIDPQPTRTVGPAPTVVAHGSELPGQLLFVVHGDLWLWEGERGRQLTQLGNAYQPAWSPDGEQIVYVERGDSYSDLILMPASGGEPQRLTNNESSQPPESIERTYDSVWAFYPVFAPDGSEIAFASQYGPPFGSPASEYNLGLYTIAPEAYAERIIRYADETGHVGRITYTPDGASVVFSFGPAGQGVPQLYRFDPNTETAEPVPGVPGQSYDPAYSPNGAWLAYAAREGDGTDIFAIPATGGTPVRITTIGAARSPVFSADGTLLAFLAIAPGERSFDLWVIELAVGANGTLTPGEPRRISNELGIDVNSGLAWNDK